MMTETVHEADYVHNEHRKISFRLITFYDPQTDEMKTRLDVKKEGRQFGVILFASGISDLEIPKGIHNGAATKVNGLELIVALEKLVREMKKNGFGE